MTTKTKMLCATCALGVGLMPCAGRAAITPTYADNDKTIILNLDSGEDTLDIAIPSGVTKVRKTGAGKITLTQVSSAKAQIYVEAGTLAPGLDAALGTHSSVLGITISAGATLDVSNLMASFGGMNLTVAGSGAEGQEGAIVRSAGGLFQGLFARMTLTGDTTFYAATGNAWSVGQVKGGSSSYYMTMNGHALTLKGAMRLGNDTAGGTGNLTSPGDIILADGASVQWSSCELNGDSAGKAGRKLVLGNGSTFYYYMIRPACQAADWKITVAEGNTANFYLIPQAGTHMKYPGDLDVAGALGICAFGQNYDATFPGNVTGGGRINFFKGNSDSKPIIIAPTAANSETILRNLDVAGCTVTFQDAGFVAVTNRGYTTGTLFGAGDLTVGAQNIWNANLSKLILTGNTYLGHTDVLDDTVFKELKWGWCTDYYTHQIAVGTDKKVGVLEVVDGATITNSLRVGIEGGYGAFYIRGDASKVCWTTQVRTEIGNDGYGYIGLDSGLLDLPGREMTDKKLGAIFLMGREWGRGYIVQRGGTAHFGLLGGVENQDARSLWITKAKEKTHAEYVQLGGTTTLDGYLNFFGQEESIKVGGDSAGLTVGGGSTAATFTATDIVNNPTTNANARISWVNINENGTLSLSRIFQTQSGTYPQNGYDYSSTKFYVNFNGGTLKLRETRAEFSDTANALKQPTRVTIFAGGATIDTDGHDVGWSVALQAPAGKGIKSVTLPATALEANKFIGPLRVKVTSGAGEGVDFSAITDFDNINRKQTGVIVTCPGFGFAETPTVVAEGRSYGYDNTSADKYDCTVTMEDLPTTGGLTKKGAGTFTLKCANTYGGTTRVEAGTLAFTHAQGYPGGTLEIPVASIQSATKPFLTAVNFALNAGAKIRITGLDQVTAATFGRSRVIATFTNAAAENLVTALETPDAETALWNLRLTDGGKTLRFGANNGTAIMIR